MNEERSFERFVADNVAGNAHGIPLPDDFYDDMHSFATTTRQRPEWLALIKEPPMRSNSHVAVGSPSVRLATIVIATLLLAATVIGAGFAGARLFAAGGPIVVDQSGEGTTTTITEAVAMAQDGDEVLVREGTYVESILIDKDIAVRGDGSTDRIVVSAVADGPTFTTSPDAGAEPYAFLLADSAATLSGLTLQGQSSSVIASGGSPTIEDNVFDAVGQPFDGVSYAFAGSAIVVTDGSTAVIMGNDLLSSGEIVAFGGSGPTIEGNHLVDSGPIWLEDASGDTAIVDNTVEGEFVRGISVSSPGRIRIEGNRISGASDIGLRIGRNSGAAGYEPLVIGNTISGSGIGIIVTDDGSPTIEDNTLVGNRSGIALGNDATGSVASNTLQDNIIGLHLDRSSAVAADNFIEGGQTGISITGGAAELAGNTVENVDNRGIEIGAEGQPILRGNRSCGNGEDLWISDLAEPVIDDSNEICDA